MMGYTPNQIVDYILEEHMEAEFLANMQLHKGEFSIGEIPDKYFKLREGKYFFRSKLYSINTEITDEDIITAVHNQLYISVFISRKSGMRNVHFLLHQYPKSMKSQFEDEITQEVIRYMILMTVLALRLDTKEKVKAYIS